MDSMNLTVVERETRLIGAIMVERGLLTPAQLREALEVQAEQGGLLGEIVMAQFGVSQVQLSQVIAEQLAELEAEAGSDSSSSEERPQLRQSESRRTGRPTSRSETHSWSSVSPVATRSTRPSRSNRRPASAWARFLSGRV